MEMDRLGGVCHLGAGWYLSGVRHMPERRLLYTRDLPGGGYVAVEAEVAETGAVESARLTVERRADRRRRQGHTPPVLAIVEGGSLDMALPQLYQIAGDNVSLAQHIHQWDAGRGAPGI
jgi:hypothetical protein